MMIGYGCNVLRSGQTSGQAVCRDSTQDSKKNRGANKAQPDEVIRFYENQGHPKPKLKTITFACCFTVSLSLKCKGLSEIACVRTQQKALLGNTVPL